MTSWIVFDDWKRPDSRFYIDIQVKIKRSPVSERAAELIARRSEIKGEATEPWQVKQLN